MIRFELFFANPRLSGVCFNGQLQLTTAGQSYSIPFDADFESDIRCLYQAIDNLIKPDVTDKGNFKDESSDIKQYHQWSLVKDSHGEVLFNVYQLVPETKQKTSVFEYRASWLSFIIDFSKISETNGSNDLQNVITAWNTLLKRQHKKIISNHNVLYSGYYALKSVFKTITYLVKISELLKESYLDWKAKMFLRALQGKYETVKQTIAPMEEYLCITWFIPNTAVPIYTNKIDWSCFDHVLPYIETFRKEEEVTLFKQKSPLISVPLSAFAESEYGDYAKDYASYFGNTLYDYWFRKTQFWK